MSEPVRWGILGNAWIARDFMIPALDRSELCRLTAVASRGVVPEELAPGARHYNSYEALLEDPEVDVVYVPVPNAFHARWCIAAMEHGKHVLCEKPMACTAVEGRRMVQTAQEHGVLLMEAFMYRYSGAFRELCAVLGSGVLGRISGMQGSFGYLLDWDSPTRQDPALGGGCLYDVGCYVVDCMNAVMRRQGAVLADTGATFCWQGGVDWHAVGWLRYDNGTVGTIQSWFDGAPEQHMLLIGERGTLCVPNLFEPGCSRLELTVDGHTSVRRVAADDPYQLEAEAFSLAVLGMEGRRIPLAHTLSNLDAIDRLYQGRSKAVAGVE